MYRLKWNSKCFKSLVIYAKKEYCTQEGVDVYLTAYEETTPITILFWATLNQNEVITEWCGDRSMDLAYFISEHHLFVMV